MNYTLAFDVYGTLINTSGVFQSLEKLIGDKAQSVMDMWRSKQLEYSFRRATMDFFTDFSVCTKDALNYSCLFHEIDLSEKEKQALMDEYKVLPAFEDVHQGIPALKKAGHQLFAFSNGSGEAIKALLINAKILHYFDGYVSVEDVQMFKPHPKVYKHFNRSTNSLKENSWLISGNPFDIIGATHYGMKSAWVKRNPQAVFDPWGIEPTKEVSSLLALEKVLQET